MKRILFIQPPFYRLMHDQFSLTQVPLGLASLSSYVRNNTDWQPRIYNADFTADSAPTPADSYLTGEGWQRYRRLLAEDGGSIWHEVAETIRTEAPDVIGLTGMSPTLGAIRKIARIAKTVLPSATIVLGGAHASMVPGECLDTCPDLDFCVFGEGELTLAELLACLDGSMHDFGAIAGLAWRHEGRVEINPRRELIAELDTLPFVFDGVDDALIARDKYPSRAFSHLFASRGCPYGCTFCGSRMIWTRRHRSHSAARIYEDMNRLKSRFHVSEIVIDDDTFGVSRDILMELCSTLIQRPLGISWSAELHPLLVLEDRLALMKKAGCRMLWMGVESGSDAMLTQINKGVTRDRIIAAARLVKKMGFRLKVFFMVGFPQETAESLAETKQLMLQIPADVIIYSIFTPYPGTPIFEECRAAGLIPPDYDPGRYAHQGGENAFTMHFTKQEFRAEAREIESLVRKLNRKYLIRYFATHPRALGRKISSAHFGYFFRAARRTVLGKL